MKNVTFINHVDNILLLFSNYIQFLNMKIKENYA